MLNTAIVIPVYNNPKTIRNVVLDALELNIFTIVVDDGSHILVETLLNPHPLLFILRHALNKGKGEAILTGTLEAKKRGFEYIVTIDGDGQHYPKEILHLLPKLNDHHIVIGNRKFAQNVPNASKFGRFFSNFWIFVESGRWLHDTQSGFRAYPISILDLALTHSRYDFEIEVLVKHLWGGKKIEEVDIEVYYPPKGERVSHFDKLRDNIRLSKLHTKLVVQNTIRLLSFLSN